VEDAGDAIDGGVHVWGGT